MEFRKMKRFKNFILILVVAATGSLFAQDQMEQTYKNGFALVVDKHLPLNASYYLGKNNDWSLFAGVSPFTRTISSDGLKDYNRYGTSIGAGVNKFFSIARKRAGNRIFLRQGLYWHQNFGQAFNTANVKSSWLVGWGAGLQFRLTPDFYIEISSPVVKYAQTKFSSIDSPILPVSPNKIQRHFSVFSCTVVRFTYKI